MQTSRATPEYGSPLQAQQAGVAARVAERIAATHLAAAGPTGAGFLAVF
jgi:hypothetical protein